MTSTTSKGLNMKRHAIAELFAFGVACLGIVALLLMARAPHPKEVIHTTSATTLTSQSQYIIVPRWVTCNLLQDDEQWSICYLNINKHHARWTFAGNYDGHQQVWMLEGPTTIFVTRDHWSETS